MRDLMTGERTPQGPWWHHRRPETDAERLEYAALTWTPDQTMERVRFVRDRHPDLLAGVAVNITFALETYEKRRQAAVDAGRTVAELDEDVVARIDGAAAILRDPDMADGSRIASIDAERRAAFRAAITDGATHPKLFAIFGDWQDARIAEVRRLYRQEAARRDIGHRTGHVPELQRLVFSVELDAALRPHRMSSARTRPPAPR